MKKPIEQEVWRVRLEGFRSPITLFAPLLAIYLYYLAHAEGLHTDIGWLLAIGGLVGCFVLVGLIDYLAKGYRQLVKQVLSRQYQLNQIKTYRLQKMLKGAIGYRSELAELIHAHPQRFRSQFLQLATEFDRLLEEAAGHLHRLDYFYDHSERINKRKSKSAHMVAEIRKQQRKRSQSSEEWKIQSQTIVALQQQAQTVSDIWQHIAQAEARIGTLIALLGNLNARAHLMLAADAEMDIHAPVTEADEQVSRLRDLMAALQEVRAQTI